MPHTLTVLAYDIPSDSKRTRLYHLLKQYGTPVQKSVFEARLSPAERRQLLERVRPLLDPKEDRLVLYTVPPHVENQIVVIGAARPDTSIDSYFLV